MAPLALVNRAVSALQINSQLWRAQASPTRNVGLATINNALPISSGKVNAAVSSTDTPAPSALMLPAHSPLYAKALAAGPRTGFGVSNVQTSPAQTVSHIELVCARGPTMGTCAPLAPNARLASTGHQAATGRKTRAARQQLPACRSSLSSWPRHRPPTGCATTRSDAITKAASTP